MTSANDLDDLSAYGPTDAPATLAQLEEGMRALNERVDQIEDRAVDSMDSYVSLEAEVTALRDDLDELIPKEKEDPPPPQWWVDRAEPKHWDELIAWVDRLRASTSLTQNYVVPPCWPAHPGVVEELAALHAAWKLAVLSDAATPKAGTAAYIAWYDRWLWPCLNRVANGTGYRITSCRSGGHEDEPARRVPSTDRAHVPGAARR